MSCSPSFDEYDASNDDDNETAAVVGATNAILGDGGDDDGGDDVDGDDEMGVACVVGVGVVLRATGCNRTAVRRFVIVILFCKCVYTCKTQAL